MKTKYEVYTEEFMDSVRLGAMGVIILSSGLFFIIGYLIGHFGG